MPAPDRPAPPAVTPAEREHDALRVIDGVRTACLAADEADPCDEATSMHLKHQGLASARAWLAGDDGFGLLIDGELTLAVSPHARGQSAGGRLAAAALAAPGPITAWSHGDHPAATVIAAHHGLTRARELWVMRRPTSLPLPPLKTPDDVLVRSYRETDAADLLRINAAAFAAHPEQGSMDAANLHARMAEDWYDARGLLIAVSSSTAATEEMLGFHWTKQHSPDLGEVYVVGISPSAQGRGLGRLLTLTGLHHLASARVEEVLLYVESDNAPAVHVYSALGFTHTQRDTHVHWRR